jgi:hypothetical protein
MLVHSYQYRGFTLYAVVLLGLFISQLSALYLRYDAQFKSQAVISLATFDALFHLTSLSLRLCGGQTILGRDGLSPKSYDSGPRDQVGLIIIKNSSTNDAYLHQND